MDEHGDSDHWNCRGEHCVRQSAVVSSAIGIVLRAGIGRVLELLLEELFTSEARTVSILRYLTGTFCPRLAARSSLHLLVCALNQ